MTEQERRQYPQGRREGRERRNGYGNSDASSYDGVERRMAERRSGLNRRSMLPR